MSKQRNLFLENQEPKCLVCFLLDNVVYMFDVAGIILGLHILLMNIGRQGTRSIDRSNCSKIDQTFRLGSLTEVLSSRLCELENACPVSLLENVLIYLLIIKVYRIWM